MTNDWLLFFAAYVICKKNYSFSRVVFLFFQSKIANYFYSKKMTAVRLGQHGSKAVGPGLESLSCQKTLQFRIVTPPPSTPLLIHNFFPYRKFSEAQKGSPTKLFGTVRLKIFDGKSWYPLICIKFFETPNFRKHKGPPFEIFRYCETKKSPENRDAAPLSMHEHFRYHNVFETQKGSPRKFFGTVRQKFFDRKSWYTPVVHKIFPYPKLVKH